MQGHASVLLEETLRCLAPKEGDRILDVTLGLGGHASALLSAASGSRLIGLDADERNLDVARTRLSGFGDRVLPMHGTFGKIPDCLPENERSFDVILADLGLSSPHLDDPERGFSFRFDAPLDMRFDASSGMTAAHLISSFDRESLKNILASFGELRRAHVLVDLLIKRRGSDPVRTTFALRDAVIEAYGHVGRDLLPQVFQALRMAVNDEVRVLETLLHEAPKLLSIGGRFAVITFHSIEDRLVKQAFRSLAAPEKDPVTGSVEKEAGFELLLRKPIAPSEKEVAENPRSRSAMLRAIRRLPSYTSHRF